MVQKKKNGPGFIKWSKKVGFVFYYEQYLYIDGYTQM